MKNMRKSATLLIFSLFLSISAFAEINFIAGDLRAAKERAAREGKLILLDFWAGYCTPCRMMEEYTFTNPDVEDYIKANYIPVKVDIESFDGFDLKSQYRVSVLPTLIVLTSKGSTVGRHEETFSASRLIPVLAMYNEPKNRTKLNSPNSIALSEPRNNDNTRVMSSSASRTPSETKITKPIKNEPADISKPFTETKLNKLAETKINRPTEANVYKKIRATTSTPSVKNNTPHLGVDGAIATEAQSNTFTVQIAAYFNESQLREAMIEVKRDYENKQKIFVSRRKEGNKFVYRILLGQFANRQMAMKYMKSIGVEGVIKDFDSMK